MKPDKFNGSGSVDTFLAQFDICSEYNGWTERDKAAHLKCCVTGTAGQLLWDTGCPDALTYTELRDKLRRRFGSDDQQEKFQAELRARRRRRGETLAELYQDIRRLMTQAYPGEGSSSLCEQIAKDYFIATLGDRDLELKIREREPRDLESAFKHAVRLEAYDKAVVDDNRDPYKGKSNRNRQDDGLTRKVEQLERRVERATTHQSTARPEVATAPDVRNAITNDATIKELKDAMAKLSRNNDELSKEVGRLRLLEERRKEAGESSNGPPPAATQSSNAASPEQPVGRPPRRCFHCQGVGHFIRDCEQRKKAQCEQSKGVTAQPQHSNEAARGQTYLRLVVNGKSSKCLLDTGSDVTLLPTSLVTGVNVEPTDRRIRAANGTRIKVNGTATVEAHAGAHHMTITGLVSPHVDEVMLGIGFLKQERAVWNFDLGEVILGGYCHKLSSRGRQPWCRRVILQDDVIVPAQSEMDLPTLVQYSDLSGLKNNEQVNWVTEAHEITSGVCVSRTVVPDRDEDVPVRVINVTKSPVAVKAGTVISDLDPAQVCEVSDATAATPEKSPGPELLGMADEVDDSVSDADRRRLVMLLMEFSNAFSTGENDLGWTNVVTHSIETGDNRPVRQPLRRHPPAHLEAIQQHVSNMLEQGVITPARSPWASNLVLVKKKDGSLRCCVDYRQLNSLTKKDAYPLPRTDMCLDAMSGARWFSTFDLRSSYHQVAMKEEDSEKTAFICREGQFKFTTMPFGLCNAGATFQRLMDMVMSGLAFEVCLVYLDDVIVFSSTMDEHFDRLRSVLTRLKGAGLKLKPSKCRLLQKHVAFLGHIVSENGISTDPDKVRAVTDWPVPTNLREVRSFVGLCSYYRRFVLGFATISAPLHDMTKKGRTFQWTRECQEAFDQLKVVLTSAPILAMPDDQGTFILDTDAANSSIGAVLSQVQQGVERVVAYASRKLSKAEMNYCVTRRELLAVVHFIKYYKHYLLGRRFMVRTDHAALQWLRKMPEPVGQQARWIGFLEEFTFDVVHRPGSRHQNADALSRRPCRSGCCEEVAATVVEHGADGAGVTVSGDLWASTCDAAPQNVEVEDTASLIDPTPIATADVTATSATHNPADLVWSKQELRAAQLADGDINIIRAWLADGGEKPPWERVAIYSSVTKTLWQQWSRLVLLEGILYRKFYGADGLTTSLQLVLPFQYRTEFIRLAHGDMTGGHLGRKRTEVQVQRRGYWPGWSEDVRRFLRTCGPCTQYHRGPPPRLAPLNPMLVGEPFERVSIDITGPHPRSVKGHIFLLTVMDNYTKWAEAIPLRNHTAPTVARALMTHVFARFGMPLQLLSDRGPEFESELFQELCRWMEIDKVRTTAYRPSTNGMVERYHRTLNSILGKIIREDQRNWCEKVPIAAAAYRASVHEATGYTPNHLMLNREVYAPLDIIAGPPSGDVERYESADDFVVRQQQMMRDVYASVREHLQVAASRRKRYYDIRVKERNFRPGMWVWYYYPRRNLRKSPKWQKTYIGPYLITKVLPPADAVLQKTRRSTPFVAHFDKLKTFYGNQPVDWRCPTPPTEPAPEHDSGLVHGSPPKQATADSFSNPIEDTDAVDQLLDSEYVEPTTSTPTQTPQMRRRRDRTRRLPKKFDDFVVATCRSDNGSSPPTHAHERRSYHRCLSCSSPIA